MAQEQSPLKKRKRIGLIFTGDYAWIGGLYYVLNIIKSLNFLEDADKPEIVIFYSEITPLEIINEISYTYVTFRKINQKNFLFRGINRLRRLLFNYNTYFERVINEENLDAIYPFSEYFPRLKLNCTIVYWIYDFQHKYLPELFSKEDIETRNRKFENIAMHAGKIVCSSYDSLNSFRKFYPDSKAALYVLQFVSVIDEEKIYDFNIIKKKYKIDRPYFIVANQFWQHKNHIVVLKALTELIKEFPEILIVFTGRQHDHRNKFYFTSLLNFIKENKQEDNIIFTDFIPREDQLCLMKNSMAVIQPSKFEGWSTVIEDAKTMNKIILASDINVHKEQLKSNNYFFPPDNEKKLAELMRAILLNDKGFAQNYVYNYLQHAKEFAHNFVQIF